MYKIAVVTSSRADYGLLKWVMSFLKESKDFELQLIATGAHLSSEQGLTYRFIEEDGFSIDYKIEMLLSSNTPLALAKSMGICNLSLSESFQRLSPDMVLVLGDRYELLPICSTALVMDIPIAHMSGGDITEGAIDNEVRNAVTMMASLHLPGVEESAQNIIRMRNSNKNVFTVGEPGIENFCRGELMGREELADNLKIDLNKKWILVTFHPETKCSITENLIIARRMLAKLKEYYSEEEIVITKSNVDLGGDELNELWNLFQKENINVSLYSSLGQRRYNSFMKQAALVVGNSSSGIVEAPFFGIPVINIGNRQNGRHLCSNIIQTLNTSEKEFNKVFLQAKERMQENVLQPDSYWGDGDTSHKVLNCLRWFFQK